MYFIIDRIESGIAVCNCMATGENIEVSLSELPLRIKEGDAIAKNKDGYVYDKKFTRKRLADMTDKMNRLFKT
jgi:hypothetical protein